jgi:predicted nucleotide-binding protein
VLKTQETEAARILSGIVTKEEHARWVTTTKHWLEQSLGQSSPKIHTVMNAGHHAIIPSGATAAWWDKYLRQQLEAQRNELQAVIGILEAEVSMSVEEPGSSQPTKGRTPNSVFIVHGHSQAALQAAARFVNKLGLREIILHEQANEGRTIIEKFEDHSHVEFALVLLTPDDRGGKEGVPYEQQQGRARQNVILELGFFLGKLERKRVCALYQQGTELPSDYHGVLFIPMDDTGAWQMTLARELQRVFPDVDLNKAI